MSERRVPWTLVCHTTDGSPPAAAVADLATWMSQQPSIDLRTVLWATGWKPTTPLEVAPFTDVGAIHDGIAPRALRRAGLGRLGGGLAGRSVRAALREVPTDGIVYLSSAQCAPILRYLPPGDRRVVTHLYALDRRADPPLADDKVAALLAATDVWLADDEETQAWAASEWGIDEAAIAVVPPPVDPTGWNRAMMPTGADQLRLGVAGGAWFGRDHTPRLAQLLLRQRPSLDLQLVWTRSVTTREHLGPLLHDLERLGLTDVLELSTLPDGVVPLLDEVDALALALPDEDAPWLIREALDRGVPIVCFDTHRAAADLRSGGGAVVPYPDVGAMARALLHINDDDDSSGATSVVQRRAGLRRRDVRVVGPRIMELAAATVST